MLPNPYLQEIRQRQVGRGRSRPLVLNGHGAFTLRCDHTPRKPNWRNSSKCCQEVGENKSQKKRGCRQKQNSKVLTKLRATLGATCKSRAQFVLLPFRGRKFVP
jgi:hypothetical protein